MAKNTIGKEKKIFIDLGEAQDDAVSIVISPIQGHEKTLDYDDRKRDLRLQTEKRIYETLGGEIQQEYVDDLGVRHLEYPVHVFHLSPDLKNHKCHRYMPQLFVVVFVRERLTTLLGRDLPGDISQMLLLTISEMAKNTVDHTADGTMYFKVLLDVDEKNNLLRFSFLLGDEGEGIYHKVSKEIQETQPEIVYNQAFLGGWSSSGDDDNFGDGLSIIKEHAKDLNMDMVMADHGQKMVLHQTKDEPFDTHMFSDTINALSEKMKFYYIGSFSLPIEEKIA